MGNAQQAFVAKERGDNILASKLYIKAFEIEKEVALSLENNIENEPTRSVIFRSAASLANICGLYDDAKKLIILGLSGNPPKDIEHELRALMKKITNNSYGIHLPLYRISQKQFVSPRAKITRRGRTTSTSKVMNVIQSKGMKLTTFAATRKSSKLSLEIIRKVVSQTRRSNISH